MPSRRKAKTRRASAVPPKDASQNAEDVNMHNDKDVPESRKRKRSKSAANEEENATKCRVATSTSSRAKSQKLLPGRYVRHTLIRKAQGDLMSFKGSMQLFSACKDALEGLAALHETGTLHGSVAPKHITINKDGSASLVDWDIPGVESLPPRGT